MGNHRLTEGTLTCRTAPPTVRRILSGSGIAFVTASCHRSGRPDLTWAIHESRVATTIEAAGWSAVAMAVSPSVYPACRSDCATAGAPVASTSEFVMRLKTSPSSSGSRTPTLAESLRRMPSSSACVVAMTDSVPWMAVRRASRTGSMPVRLSAETGKTGMPFRPSRSSSILTSSRILGSPPSGTVST